jgi:hypothetical protein
VQAVVGYYTTETAEKEVELNKKLNQLYSFDLSNFEKKAKAVFGDLLVAFFGEKNPSKLPLTPAFISYYFTNQGELNTHLEAIYGTGLPAPVAP